MDINKRRFRPDATTGFGTKGTDAGDRFYRKDGTVNMVRRGVNLLDQLSWYHTLISMSRWRFFFVLWMVYIIVNLIFALIYYFIGVEHLGGIQTGSPYKNFAEAFFFSAQTFTTVGYGRISPVGFLASAVAAFEAFIGLLAFALASGLFYGRFSRPRAYLYFSEKALISPYKDGKALMFRTVPYKTSQLTDAEVKLTLAIRKKHGDEIKNEFYPLSVEFSKINALVMNWTIVHPITEDSPMYGQSLKELKDANAQILVLLKAYDEVFANSVIARASYIADDIIENAKFKTMYHASASRKTTILNVDALNDYELLSP
jgi:inward rectifier potassium channel